MPRQSCLLIVPLLAIAFSLMLVYVPQTALEDPSLEKYTLDSGYQEGVPVERALWKAGAWPLEGISAGGRYIDWREAAYNSRWHVPVLVGSSGGVAAFGERLPSGPLIAVTGPKPGLSILDIAPTAGESLGIEGDFEGRPMLQDHVPQVIVVYIDSLGWYRYREFRPVMPNLSKAGEPVAAASVFPSISRVNGAAMLTGVGPERSGIDAWENRTLLVPGIVGLALEQNISAAWIDGPHPPVTMPAGMVRVQDIDGDGTVDDEVTDRAIREHLNGTRLLYVHLKDLDRQLHATGPYSAESREAAVQIDGLVGQLLSRARPGTLILITADHGGHDIVGGKGEHGSLLPDDMLIPIFVKRA